MKFNPNLPVVFQYSRLWCLLIAIAILPITGGCSSSDWEDSYKSAAKRSLIPEVDLILVPEPFSLIDEKWLGMTKTTTYNLETLKRQVTRYGGNWDIFMEENKDRMHVDKGVVRVETQGTSHFTNYDYDRKIPIFFHGKRFFHHAVYQDRIFQQHIVPTIARILDSPNPDGVLVPSLDRAIRKEWIIPSLNRPKRPEVVLTIVIDQGGLELYNAHPKSFPNIKRLMDNSAYFPGAEVGHLDAHTGVGHTAIGTGAFPKQHEVIANDRTYIQILSQPSQLGESTKTNQKIVKVTRNVFQISKNLISPEDMKTETLADVWDFHRNNLPVIISQCYAVRASIGMAGHGAMKPGGDKDIVYWVDKKPMAWTTNSDYFRVPAHVSKYNLTDYNRLNNPNPWWKPDAKLDAEFFSKNFYNTVATPTQARLEGELFRETIQKELIATGLGKDGETDLLYLTLKATDAVGHAHGWESEEARLVLEETDRQVGLIWRMMEEEWGEDYILVLTADHGAAPLREFSKGLYLKFDDFLATIQSLLPESERDKVSLVNFYTTSMLSLNKEAMEKYGISEYSIRRAILGIEVDGRKFFRKIYTRQDLEK